MERIRSLLSLEMSPPQTTTHIDPALRVDLVVNDPKDLSQLLDQAVERTIPTALERRHGILVTQIFPNRYMVEVDKRVPCGVIHEKRIHPHAM
jgi:hypothetical protein